MHHPLAQRLIQDLRGSPDAPVADLAAGRGRNSAALRAAGLTVTSIDDAVAESDEPFRSAAGPFAAVLSTHGLLHGTPALLRKRLAALARHLVDGGRLYATFGSTHDARFGCGTRIDAATFAPATGEERGIPHVFFSEATLRRLLERWFAIESMDEHGVDDLAGRWAHRREPLAHAVHWFVVARKREPRPTARLRDST